MKSTIKIAACLFLSASLLCGCSMESRKAGKVAESFLTAFFNMEYETAGSFCAGDLAAEIQESISDVELPSEEMTELVKEASMNTTFDITKVDTKSEKGVATVEYLIHPYGNEETIERSMLLIKEKGKWLVLQLF
ncbi:MAG: hypothetical protein IJS02_04575 [Bacteroidales bacterium]|nr:hypothetical protein [Bacteroidales bacterium]